MDAGHGLSGIDLARIGGGHRGMEYTREAATCPEQCVVAPEPRAKPESAPGLWSHSDRRWPAPQTISPPDLTSPLFRGMMVYLA